MNKSENIEEINVDKLPIKSENRSKTLLTRIIRVLITGYMAFFMPVFGGLAGLLPMIGLILFIVSVGDLIRFFTSKCGKK